MDQNTLKWLKDQVTGYVAIQSTYKEMAEALNGILKIAKERYAPLGHVDSRVKTIAGFAEKAVRKKLKEDKYGDPLNSMTDLAGARIVVYTLDEAREVCLFLEREGQKPERERCLWIDWANSQDTRKRMKVSEFGYDAKHYVVELRKDNFLGMPIPSDIQSVPGKRCFKGEIQVHTMCQNTWSVIGHDRLYKTQLHVPDAIKREMHAMAAALESDDTSFARCVAALDRYTRHFNAYKTPVQLQDDIHLWQVICEESPSDKPARHQLGRCLMAARRWPEALEALREFRDMERADIQQDLGESAWRAGNVRLARDCLAKALDLESDGAGGWRTLCLLADTYRKVSPSEAIKHYQKALEMAPSEPEVLAPLVECHIRQGRTLRKLNLLQGTLCASGNQCHERATLGVYLPHAHFNCARLRLYRGAPYEALNAYAMAVSACHHPEPMLDELGALTDILTALSPRQTPGARLGVESLKGFEWARRLLIVALAAKASLWRKPERKNEPDAKTWIEAGEAVRKELESLATPGLKKKRPFDKPIVFVAGGCDPAIEKKLVAEYGELLQATFRAFSGTIISGGTTAGISGMVGQLCPLKGRTLHRVGYLPAGGKLPNRDKKSAAYEVRSSPGTGYNPAGVLRAWADILLQTVRPDQIRMLVINGGELTEFESRLGLALGAGVGAADDSGRIVKTLLEIRNPCRPQGLAPLPRDAAIWSAFIRGASPRLDLLSDDQVDPAAKYVHAKFCQKCVGRNDKHDASVLPWDELPDAYKRSNVHQVRFATLILDEVGYAVVPARSGKSFNPKNPPVPKDYEDKVDAMAKLEHGRFCAERLAEGWRFGEKKDLAKKLNPTLVPWEKLSPEVQDFDREAVKNFPKWLAAARLKIVCVKGAGVHP